jgi:thiamine-phosphate pyrophosphorylase
MSKSFSPELYRVIDANVNRLKEGIRVIEDVVRYRDNNKELASALKALRHKATVADTLQLLTHRDSINDVLRASTKSEQSRTDIEGILLANFKRAQESARVLEEMYKLVDVSSSESFKSIRYQLYNFEKELILREQ